MKKKLAVCVLAAVMVLGLAACGKGAADSGSPDQEAAEQKTEESAEKNEDAEPEEADSGLSEETETEASPAGLTEEASAGQTQAAAAADDAMTEDPHPVVAIEVQDYGTITVELDRTAAPVTVENFLNLVDAGFYDGLTFHRIIAGFMIQGGDPLGNGTGGADKTIPGEFRSNGFDNPISHKRAVISMARAMDPNSASSQFFIMHQDGDYLDGEYAAFGHVTEGMEIVDQICENTEVVDNNGTVLPEKQPVIVSIKRVE